MAYRIDKDLEVDGGAKVSAAPSTDTDVVRKLELDAEAQARSDADDALQGAIDDHVDDTTAAHAAAAIGFTPAGDIAATNVQAAIEELDAEKLAGTGLNVAAAAPVGQAYGIDEVEVSDGLLVALTLTTLGTAALASTTDFATAAQGAKADTAVQPADLVGLTLPDYSGAADGDVLTITGGVPAWEPPTGGTGSGLADLWLVTDSADDEPILDSTTGTLVRDLAEATA